MPGARGGGPDDAAAGPTITPTEGGFEWRPASDPAGRFSRRIAHEWMDAEKGRRVVSTLTFELPDATPHELVGEATRRGLKRASDALPGRGKVKLRGEVEDVRGPTTLVRVRLDVMGFGADGAWAEAAAGAFARAFVERLEKKGWAARRR